MGLISDEQGVIDLRLQCIPADHAMLPHEPEVALARDGIVGNASRILFIVVELTELDLIEEDDVALLAGETSDLKVRAEFDQSLELALQLLEVPGPQLRGAVGRQAKLAHLRRGEVRAIDHRHALKSQLRCSLGSGVAIDDLVSGNQNRLVEAKLPDRLHQALNMCRFRVPGPVLARA